MHIFRIGKFAWGMQSACDDWACQEDQEEMHSHDLQPSLHRSWSLTTEHVVGNWSTGSAANGVCKN